MESSKGPQNKTSMADILDQSSCSVCQAILRMSHEGLYLSSCRIHSSSQIKQSILFSTECKALEKQNVLPQVHGEHRQNESILDHVKGKEESHVRMNDTIESEREYGPEQCFLASSLYYGGPDVLSHIPNNMKGGQSEVTVKELEEAMNPFHLEYTTRGNWWGGSFDY
ncbi:uncharacterized protein LOC131061191 [Cryptomeria japonica]|uniref:uncharacterized protein LOC131061191 n=1 Tax=Cryptomeria japonica TaxID=3369 RepID=UPI0027DA5716|nr:uncharacterized protein LOC131061191 [Cryptomeria japonica]